MAATLLDAACGYAGLPMPDGGALGNAVTVTLSISYLGQGDAADGCAPPAASPKMGRSIYFASGELVADSGELIATAQGAFKRTSTPPRG